MHYPRILALIDAELDRLHRARLLLASYLGSSGRAAKKRTGSRGRPAIREITRAKQTTSSPNEGKSHQDPRLHAKAIPRRKTRQVRRTDRPTTRAPIAPRSAGPLAGVVPSGPVFVSARQVQELHSARQTSQAPDHDSPSATDNLTPEFLRQRWLHGSSA
jgi:hypothetical protein